MITVISYPAFNINLSVDEGTSTDSAEMVKIFGINVSDALDDEYIEITYNDETVTLLITDECRYDPTDIFFLNKEGAQQSLTFFKVKKESLSVESEEFESDRGQPNEGNHQFVQYNVQGKSRLTLNSGFVQEELNESFKQLFLSSRIWIYDGVRFIPMKLAGKTLEYKTRQNDRLINYEIQLEYAFNEINNI